MKWCVRLASRRSTHKRSHKHYKQHLQEQHPDQAAPAVLFSKSKRTKAGGRRTVHDGHSLEAPVSRAAASAAAPALLGVGSSDSNEELGASNSGQQQTAAMFPGGGWLNDQRKIGLGLTAFGFLFTFLGVLLFFDRGLLAMGNLLFLAGMTITIGVQATIQFFSRRKNRKGSAFYLSGAGLVVVGWTIIGLCVEAYGFWLLFCEFLPTVLQFSRRVPFMSKVLDMPFLKVVINKISLMGGLPTSMEDANGRSR